HRKLQWIGWLDDARAFTLDENALTLWNVEYGQAEYQINASQPQAVAFSPGRKQVALVAANGVAVYSADNGDLLTRTPLDDNRQERQAAFSPAGDVLAVSGYQNVSIFDLHTGKLITSVFSEAANGFAKDLAWPNNEYVLVGGTDLVHVPSQMVV